MSPRGHWVAINILRKWKASLRPSIWKALWSSFLMCRATPPPGMLFSKKKTKHFPQSKVLNPHPPANVLSEERPWFPTLQLLSPNLNKLWIHKAVSNPLFSVQLLPHPQRPWFILSHNLSCIEGRCLPWKYSLGIPEKTSDNHSNLVS